MVVVKGDPTVFEKSFGTGEQLFHPDFFLHSTTVHWCDKYTYKFDQKCLSIMFSCSEMNNL